MVCFLLFFQCMSTEASLPAGTLGNFFSLNQISTIVDELKVNFTEVMSNLTLEGAIGASFHLKYLPEDFKYTRVLILGGFHAGYPMAAYQVLYTAYILAENYYSYPAENIISQSLIVDLVPVPNIAAYSKMESEYAGKEFSVYLTDLTGSPGCSKNDLGTNADHNFPYHWGDNTDQCSPQYGGPSILSSPVSMMFANYAQYDLIINFQGTGMNYYTPYASEDLSFSPLATFFYDSLKGKTPNGYGYASMFKETKIKNTGTLLDSAFSQGSLSLQVAIGKDPNLSKDSISKESSSNYLFTKKMLVDNFSVINATFLACNETINDSGEYYSTFNIQFQIDNFRPKPTNFTFKLQANFDEVDNYIYHSTIKAVQFGYEDGVNTTITVNSAWYSDGTILVIDKILPFSNSTFSFVFSRLYRNTTLNFTSDYSVVPSAGSYYFRNISNSASMTIGLNSTPPVDYTARRNAAIILLVLFASGILLTITGCVMYKKDPLLSKV